MDTRPAASPSPGSWQALAFEKAPDGMAVVQDGSILCCNLTWRRLCPVPDVLPAPLGGCIHPDDVALMQDFCQAQCLHPEPERRLVVRAATPHAGGEVRWLEATAASLQAEEGGSPTVMVCIRPALDCPDKEFASIQRQDAALMDMYRQLAQVRQELALARSDLHLREAQFLDLFEQAPVGIFLTDSAGQAQHINPFMARMVGAATEEEALAHYRDLARDLYVHPERRQEALQLLAQQGAVTNFEFQAQRLDGERIWIAMNARVRDRQPDGTFRIDGFALDVTDRKRAEQALAESESRYRALFVDNSVVMALVDPDSGGFLDVNKAACAFYGWSRETLLTMRSSDINLAPRQTLQREMAAALCGGKRYFTFRHRLASGEVRDVEVYSGPIVVRGRAFLYSCVFDITERVQAEHALRKSQQHLRHIADTVPGVLYQFKRDPQGNYSFPYVSDRARDMMDLHPADIMRDANVLHARVHEQDIGMVFELSERSAALLEPFSSVHRFTRANGELRWHKADSIPALQEDGSILWSGIVIDITDRILAEQALQQSQRRLLEAQRIAHLGHFEHHLDTGIGSWSEEILRLFDLPAGQPAPDFEAFLAGMVDQDDRAPLAEALHALKTCDAQTLRELGPPQIDRDLHIHTGSGEMRSVRFTARLEVDAQGRAALLRGVLQDVSDRARIMEELVRVTRAAEAANRVKSEFLANMSHEIRTPLHGVMGMLQVLLQSELTPEQREHADIAFSASMRLTNLLSDILDISAVESGKLRLRPAPFSLGEVLESVERLFAVFARERKLTLRIAPDPTLPAMLDGDAQRLRQILFNLVGNALKFTEAGLVTLEAHALQGSHLRRPHMLFVVSDTGLGIPEEIIPTLFEPFSQGALHQPGMVRTAQGVGLGLPIVQQLVALMGGSLCLASEPGKGSTFYVSLPLAPVGEPGGEPGGAPGGAPSGAPESPLPDTAAHPASTHQPLPAAGRILVVEDEKVNRLTVRRLLEHRGLEVQEAEDGRTALEALRREPFDLVLMDIQMPGMDGLAVTRAIRQGEAGPASAAIPIVALTAYAMAGDRERFLAAGMDGYLSKPFEFKDIGEVLQRFLPSHPTPPEHDSLA